MKRKFYETYCNQTGLIVSYIKHNVKYILQGVENNTTVVSHLARGESEKEDERQQREHDQIFLQSFAFPVHLSGDP
ncbi:hypothetical protein [Methanolacinia paynteri]|uniref:hypothetical protein n=1 Tax=Methanolacinia paynteri TaxID=230356 RepID=UPI00064EA1B7|nr:hypothetical protein [Methanolacinia paynteri]